MNYIVLFLKHGTTDLSSFLVDSVLKNSLKTLPSFCELDAAVQRVVPTLSKDMDISILTRVLVPEDTVSFYFPSKIRKINENNR